MAPDSLASVDAPDADAEGRHPVTFRVARRGYDPAQVDPVVGQMAAEVDGLRAEIAELREREADLLAALDAADDRTLAAEHRAEEALAALAARPDPLPDPVVVAVAELTEAPPGRHPSPTPGDPASPASTDDVAGPDAGEPVAGVAAMVGEETARIIEAARHAAVEIGARAREEGERLVAESREEARIIRADAEVALLQRTREADDAVAERLLEAADAVQQAQDRAERIIDDAFTEAATVVLRSREEADAIVVSGEQRSAELLAAATATRDELLVDLVRRRKLLRRQVEQLDAGRARLRAAYEVVEGALAAATDELDTSVGEARDAALAAAERADAAPDAELEAAVTALGAGAHVLAGETAPAPGVPADDPPSAADPPSADLAVGDAPGERPEADEPTLAAAVPPAPETAEPLVGRGRPERPDAVDEPSAPPPVDPDGAEADAPEDLAVAVAPGTATNRSTGAPAPDPAPEPPSVEVAPGAPGADDAVGPDLDARTGGPVATGPSGGSESDAGAPSEATSGSGERRGRRRAPDPIEFEGRWSSAVRVLPPGPDQADAEAPEPALRSSRRPRAGASVSEVFARLRSDEGQQQSLFEQSTAATAPAAGPDDVVAPATADPDPEVAWLAARDAAVAPALRALRRRLKATLADDEDALLESIHRANPVPARLDAVRDAPARRQDLVAAMTPSLTVAVAAGAGQVIGGPGSAGEAATAEAIQVDVIAAALADAIVEPLEERLERALNRYHKTVDELDRDDPAATKAGRDAALASLVSSTKAAYRARRGVQVQVPTEHAVLAAGHRGVVAALVPGTPLRWIVAAPAPVPPPRRSAKAGAAEAEPADIGPEPRMCPSCVAIADVGAGDRFGHGHLAPPARPGCRCAVAPVAAVVPRRS